MPDAWDSSRAAPFLANALVVVLVAPFVEELLYRGLGYEPPRCRSSGRWPLDR